VIDLETTGLPRHSEASLNDIGNWPRVVSVAAILYETDIITRTPKRSAHYSTIVKPDGFIIPMEAEMIHGISQHKATSTGADNAEVLAKLKELIDKASVIVAHNMQFDFPILNAEFLRDHQFDVFEGKKLYCTMLNSVRYLKVKKGITKRNGRISLEDAHSEITGRYQSTQHDALADAEMTTSVFAELWDYGIHDPFTFNPGNKVASAYGAEELKGEILTIKKEVDNPNNPFYRKKVVLAGAFDVIDKMELAERLRDLGADLDLTMSAKTDFLITGKAVEDSKMRRAFDLISEGSTLTIIKQDRALEMVQNFE
jgi:DNA polymerase III epsilon subunit-like protein